MKGLLAHLRLELALLARNGESLLLTMGIPLMLVPGAPITLALRAIEKRDDGTRGGREWIMWAVHSPFARVITHPRCMNCHPATRTPTQGEDLHTHVPLITAVGSSTGPAGIACSTCHGAENRPVVGSRLKTIPGNAHWSLAPASMAWQGLTRGEICRQIKDPARNGQRSLADIVHHVSEDHLVAWAWHPGDGRSPVPGTHEAFGALVAAWIETGAECPD